MQIQLNRNIVVEGIHRVIDDIVEVKDEVARYLLATGAARKVSEVIADVEDDHDDVEDDHDGVEDDHDGDEAPPDAVKKATRKAK